VGVGLSDGQGRRGQNWNGGGGAVKWAELGRVASGSRLGAWRKGLIREVVREGSASEGEGEGAG
jgi:hypothetical protein